MQRHAPSITAKRNAKCAPSVHAMDSESVITARRGWNLKYLKRRRDRQMSASVAATLKLSHASWHSIARVAAPANAADEKVVGEGAATPANSPRSAPARATNRAHVTPMANRVHNDA